MPVACPAEPSSNSTTVSTSKSPAPQYSCITLLLFVLILPMTMGEHRNYTSPLQLLNPWLSACDLIDPSRTPDLQGVCLATSTMVLLSTPTTDNNPDSNNNNNNNNNENVNNNNNVNINNKPNKVHQNCRVNGDISEGPGPPSMCPCACEDSSPQYSTTTTTPHQNTNQCLDYLNESHKKSVCGSSLNKNERESALNKLRFQHCCEHTVLASLDAEERKKLDLEDNGHTCEVYIDALLQLDALAESITCKFAEVLKRYDCSQTYSVNFQCADCKEAYRRWVCASLFPHFLADSRDRARPCRSVCQQVEQRCPFFLPGDRFPSYPTQYAGEPTFLCIDPNIPETGQQLVKSSYGDGGCCYHYCGGVTGFCYTDQCSTNATTTEVPAHHCEETGSGGGTSRTAVVSACSSSSAANIMVHPPLGGAASGAAHTANKTLLMNLLLHIIFLLVIGMVFGLEFT